MLHKSIYFNFCFLWFVCFVVCFVVVFFSFFFKQKAVIIEVGEK